MDGRLLPLLLVAVTAQYCLNKDYGKELRLINVDGQNFVFPLAYGAWSSAGPVAEIVRILLEEELHVVVGLNQFRSSTDLLKQTLGCTDLNGDPRSGVTAEELCEENNQDPPLFSWAAVEVWPTTSENKRLRRLLGTGSAMGYQTYPGLYTQKPVVKDGLAGQVLLRWWESYSLGADRFFDTVQELDAAMRNLSFYHANCDGWCPPETIRPLCDPDDVESVEMQELGALGQQCSGGWFYSRACMNQTLHCIPVILGEYNWNFQEWANALQEVPVAVTWVGWWKEIEMVLRLPHSRFLFYWWQPDPTFLKLESGYPEQVYFDHRSLRFDQIVSSQLVVWNNLAQHVPEVSFFLRNLQLSDEDLRKMMLDKAEGENNTYIACKWLKNNTEIWEEWMPPDHDSIGLPDFILGIIAASVVVVALAAAYGFFRSWRQYRDSPGNHYTTTGIWARKWMGSHVQVRLKLASTGYEKFALKRNWVVNATPFDLTVNHSTSLMALKSVKLSASTYGQFFYCKSEHVELEIRKPSAPSSFWAHEEEAITISVTASDWTKTAPEGTVTYDGPCARKALGPGMGHIRLATLGKVKGTTCFLVCWSPPHTLRGVPMLELAQFFRRVITHPRLRDHWQEDDEADEISWQEASEKPVSIVLTRGSTKATKQAEHAASLHNSSANMYNALSHVILPESAAFDASYAELHTKYGTANIFVSHVWAETAQNSLEAVRRLYRFVRENQLKPQQVRAWFCTVCNNQSRVTEELGSDVGNSAFYQVLQSKSIEQVALVSPLKALNRKWCNFEFSLAIHGGKPVWMVTSDGVVQAGDVPPKALRQIAEAVISFRCEESRCSTAADEAMIDAAVAGMGGYDRLNSKLKGVFRSAIEVAHTQLNEAFEMVKLEGKLEPIMSLTLPGSEDAYSTDESITPV